MRLQWDDDRTSVDVYLRQSWLSDARSCMEKARWLIRHESTSSDAAAIGTAVHAGAAAWCLDQSLDVDAVVDAALAAWDHELSMPMNWVSYNEPTARHEVINLAHAWFSELRPMVDSPVYVEHGFCFLFDTIQIGTIECRIWMKGTIDLVQTHSLWDWKTSKNKYSWHAKQNASIQASVYAAAAVDAGWLEYPVHFNFGVLLRGKREAQLVHVTRTDAHTAWLKQQVAPLVRQAVLLGDNTTWPINDDHGLCSEVWCPAWSACKGALLAPVPLPTRKAS